MSFTTLIPHSVNTTQPQLAIHSTIMDKRSTEPKLSIEKLKELYLETLTPKEYKSYIIARDHLGMSFTLEKSVGFLQWKNEFVKNAEGVSKVIVKNT